MRDHWLCSRYLHGVIMPTLVSKKKKNKKYWYIVENKTVDSKLARDYVKNLGACTKAEANTELAHYVTLNHNKGRGNIILLEAYSEFLVHYKKQIGKTIKQGTFVIFQDFTKKTFKLLGHQKLSELEYSHIERLKNHLSDDHQLSNRSVNMHLTELKKVLNYSIKRGWMTNYPQIQRLSEAKPDHAVDALTREEFANLLLYANPKQALYLNLMFYTGMRPPECVQLTWKNIEMTSDDPNKNYIDIISDNKKKAGRRVPLSLKLKLLLQEIQGEPDDYVSPYRNSKYAYTALKRLEKVSKPMVEVYPYKLRKSFGSIMAQSGAPIDRVSKIMGHSDIQTTMKYYIRLNDEVLTDCISLL